MTVIERGECPEHGAVLGFVSPEDRKAWCPSCEAYIVAEIFKYVPAEQLQGAVDRIKALRSNVDPASDDEREAAYARGYLAGVTDALERLIGGE